MPKIVDHELQRRELSATVAQVIAGCGLEHSTLRTVAARHGCTKGMVQHYFADKEELLLAALAFVEERFEESTRAASAGRQGLDRVDAGLRVQLPVTPLSCRDWQVRLVFHSHPDPSPSMAELLNHYHGLRQGHVIGGLRQAQQAGELRPGVQLRNSSRTLLALLWGMGLDAVADPARTPISAQKQILKIAIDGLRR